MQLLRKLRIANSKAMGRSSNYDIRGLSFKDIFWIQSGDKRISFRWERLSETMHFTISWNHPTRVNIHLTNNIGDSNNKPQIKIAVWEKDDIDDFLSFVPHALFKKILKPIYLSQYPRRLRRNARIYFFDEVENSKERVTFKKSISNILERNSKVKKKQLKILPQIESELPFLISETKTLIQCKYKWIRKENFDSEKARAGVIVIGNSALPFICLKGTCYTLNTKFSIINLLRSFMNYDFAEQLLKYIEESIERIKEAKSFQGAQPHSNPFKLFIETVKNDSLG